MEARIHVFSAHQGMCWLTAGEGLEEERLRRRLGKLPDFDYGDSGWRGVLVENGICHAHRCWAVDHFDAFGRDAAYLVFVSFPADLGVDLMRLFKTEAFTKPRKDWPTGATLTLPLGTKPKQVPSEASSAHDWNEASAWIAGLPKGAHFECREQEDGLAHILVNKGGSQLTLQSEDSPLAEFERMMSPPPPPPAKPAQPWALIVLGVITVIGWISVFVLIVFPQVAMCLNELLKGAFAQ